MLAKINAMTPTKNNQLSDTKVKNDSNYNQTPNFTQIYAKFKRTEGGPFAKWFKFTKIGPWLELPTEVESEYKAERNNKIALRLISRIDDITEEVLVALTDTNLAKFLESIKMKKAEDLNETKLIDPEVINKIKVFFNGLFSEKIKFGDNLTVERVFTPNSENYFK